MSLSHHVGQASWKPFGLIATYSAMTFALYLWGPLPWPKDHTSAVATIIVSTWLAFALGYGKSVKTPVLPEAPLQRITVFRVIVWGSILNAITLPVAIYGYTGKSLGEVSYSLADQGRIYLDRYQYIVSDADNAVRTAAALSRAATAPLVTGGIALMVFHWSALPLRIRVVGALSVVSQLVYSLSRGTDKELVDLAIVIGAVLLVRSSRSFGYMAVRIVGGLLLLALLFNVFLSRREVRLGESLSHCQLNAAICAESPEASPTASVIGTRNYGGLISATSYVTQGYHGLALAVPKSFPAMFGLGHNAALSRLFETITGVEIGANSYQNQLVEDGWDPRYTWSTGYSWFANDVSFFLLPVLWYVLGWGFGTSFSAARQRRSERSFVVFFYFLLLMIYMPANNQIGTSLESTVSFGVWLVAWSLHRRRVRRRVVGRPGGAGIAEDTFRME